MVIQKKNKKNLAIFSGRKVIERDSMVTCVCQNYDPKEPSDLKWTRLPHPGCISNPLFLTRKL